MQLKSWLKSQGLSVAELARLTGIHRSQLSRYANGHFIPSWPIMRRLMKATDGKVTAEDFFRTRNGRAGS